LEFLGRKLNRQHSIFKFIEPAKRHLFAFSPSSTRRRKVFLKTSRREQPETRNRPARRNSATIPKIRILLIPQSRHHPTATAER
jgi:hypothetical protein